MPGPTLITDAEVQGVLKNVYTNFREKLFPILTPLLAQVDKGRPGGPRNMRWGGNGVYFDTVLTRPVGMTSSTAGYFPPDADASERQGNIGIKRLYVTRQIDGLAIMGTQTKEAAFVALARKIVNEAKDASKLGMQEVLHGDGRAIKGIVASTADTSHAVITSPYGVSGAGQGGLLVDLAMYVAVYDTTLVTLRGKAQITAATNSGDNVTVTFNTPIVGLTATDVVTAATTSDDSIASGYPNGLINITNRSNSYASIHGISNGTWARWDAIRLVAGTDTPDANQPTEVDVWTLATRIAGVSGYNAIETPQEFLLLTTPGIYKKVAESFLGQRRFTAQEMVKKVKGGFGALEVNGIPMIMDLWCPAGTLYLLHLPSLTWVDSKDWGQVQYEGAGPWRWIQGRDAFETSWATYINFGTVCRNAHGSITGYTDTARFSFVM